jgi:hypothetical protein
LIPIETPKGKTKKIFYFIAFRSTLLIGCPERSEVKELFTNLKFGFQKILRSNTSNSALNVGHPERSEAQ